MIRSENQQQEMVNGGKRLIWGEWIDKSKYLVMVYHLKIP